jgi:hypothetical protein
MDSLSIVDPSAWYVEGLSLYPVSVVTGEMDFSFSTLVFDYQFEEDHVYNLVTAKDISDCNAVVIPAGQSYPYVWPSEAEPL